MRTNKSINYPKILHITAVRSLTNGQRQQLYAEMKAIGSLPSLHWDIIAIHNGKLVYPFEMNFPKLFRPMFLRNLYCWIYVLKKAKNYDYVLFRHLTFDPFVLFFGWFVNNRVTIHHAKAIEELKLIRKGWKGEFASSFERLTGKISAKQVRAVVGVTPEIADYVCSVHKVAKLRLFYPNGIDVESIQILSDNRSEDINAAFICGTFSSWHGLEDLIRKTKTYAGDVSLNIHLIGKLSDKQIRMANEFSTQKINYICHGYLEQDCYLKILNKCDFGIGSVSLYKKGLTEAVTLKVREYLAMGLPVVASHKDSALPDDFPFFFNVPVGQIFKVATEIKQKKIARVQVRETARPYIEKKVWIEKLIDELKNIFYIK